MKMPANLCVIAIALLSTNLWAETTQHQSPYAGQENREIKSLSADDIDQLSAGKGWGLAKAAELNGMPGPIHILEMKKEINLTPEQEARINILYEEMKAHAIPLGKQIIEMEKALNRAFAKNDISAVELKQRLSHLYAIYGELRYVHLVAHLRTPAALSKDQIKLYNKLRGYGEGDPCANIPAGHDETMWKKHNGCP